MSFMPSPAILSREVVVDLFAGGGGTSTGVEMAIGYPPDYAYNHDPVALALHMANHPQTRHGCKDIRGLDPLTAVPPGPIGLLWMSPDCRHFSRAKGSAPVSKSVRDLAWVGVQWAEVRRPRIIMLENVKEFLTWCPLLPNGKVDTSRLGETFREFVAALERLGYRVEWQVSAACRYGAFTIRERLCVIARCDGLPIIFPAPTHGDPADPEVASGILRPYRTVAECIDWSIPCASLFFTPAECEAWYRLTGQRVQRPLADNTLGRVFKGTWRYVIKNPRPYMVEANVSGLADRRHKVAAFLSYAQQGGRSRPLSRPGHTITASAKDQNQLVAVHLVNLKGSGPRGERSVAQPGPTLCAQGGHVAAVQAFLVKYYGTAVGSAMNAPAHTETAKPRFGLVMVQGEPHAIADIGMRMLTPRERFRINGFPENYQLDVQHDGRSISDAALGRLCGNAVERHWAAAHIAANYQPREFQVAA